MNTFSTRDSLTVKKKRDMVMRVMRVMRVSDEREMREREKEKKTREREREKGGKEEMSDG